MSARFAIVNIVTGYVGEIDHAECCGTYSDRATADEYCRVLSVLRESPCLVLSVPGVDQQPAELAYLGSRSCEEMIAAIVKDRDEAYALLRFQEAERIRDAKHRTAMRAALDYATELARGSKNYDARQFLFDRHVYHASKGDADLAAEMQGAGRVVLDGA